MTLMVSCHVLAKILDLFEFIGFSILTMQIGPFGVDSRVGGENMTPEKDFGDLGN